ncbi:Quinone oxidoreductase [Klebsiella pneumoniae]|uniref:Quinone oxidoreductase n=1 Tax=Klebsiella pneumoniae TaxID=573 RepID=A0A378F5Z1_KLEPN|nr:Quinone oxidoreductase [Klebsiella pneumoniae]
MLIEVKAAGVNRPDILQRQGLYPMPEGVTPVPGLEVAGSARRLQRLRPAIAFAR